MPHANATHIALHAIASETAAYPAGRETVKNAGLKMSAKVSKASVGGIAAPSRLSVRFKHETSQVVLRWRAKKQKSDRQT